jgi:transcriptional regulator
MYMPQSFVETRPEVLQQLLRAHPFAVVVTQAANGLTANHLPFELADASTLHGHVARGNELAQMDGAEVLLIFQGPDGYISPNWYPTRWETGREVPTWDYAVVHVHGHLRVIDDPVWLRGALESLVAQHESHLPQPWHITDAPPEHIENSLHAIVGIEIVIERIEGKFKLSQNHPAGNQAGAIAGIRARNGDGDAELAAFMLAQQESRQ